MNEIRIGAIFTVTDKEYYDIPKERLIEFSRDKLARELAEHITRKNDFFTETQIKDGYQYRAECYVLTPKDFADLVEKIRRDLHFYEPISIGGVSS